MCEVGVEPYRVLKRLPDGDGFERRLRIGGLTIHVII